MVNINEISKIGIGTYRMDVNNLENSEALNYAIESGINIVDTSSNYGFGNSELLLGKNIDKGIRESVFIVSKAGYIQGNDIEKIKKIVTSNYLKFSDNFLYSLDVNFLGFQFEQSIKRLNTDYIDCYLLHNPEYYVNEKFNKFPNDLKEIIFNAFVFLEGKVQSGQLRYYGISSNNLNALPLKEIFKGKFPSFKFIQFPYNIIENDLSSSNYENNDFTVEKLKKHGLITLSNRPLNTIYQGGVLRLSDTIIENLDIIEKEEEILFNSLKNMIIKQLSELNEETKLETYYPIKFFMENRKKIANVEAINKSIREYLFPFLEAINLKNNEIIKLLGELKNYWELYSKSHNQKRLEILKQNMIEEEKMKFDDKRDFSIILAEYYLNIGGIDSILMGLTKKEYIDKIKILL